MEAAGGGLSVQDINGKLPGEERGKQDDAQKATTSPGKEALQYKNIDGDSAKSAVGAGKRGARKLAS
jgi:Mn-containing catalase